MRWARHVLQDGAIHPTSHPMSVTGEQGQMQILGRGGGPSIADHWVVIRCDVVPETTAGLSIGVSGGELGLLTLTLIGFRVVSWT